MPRSATASLPVVGVIRSVLGVTCSDPECAYHESLHTGDRDEAARTARELGWRQTKSGWRCPLCVSGKAVRT